MQIYWRVHWPSAPAFSPESASSAPWSDDRAICDACLGSGRRTRGTVAPCAACGGAFEPRCQCGGTGYVAEVQDIGACRRCRGTGRNLRYRRDRGYSCCESPEALVAYFASRGTVPDDLPVVAFAGRVLGAGMDGEPLVVPRLRPRPRWMAFSDVRAVVEQRE